MSHFWMDGIHNSNISTLLTLTDASLWYGTSKDYIWGLGLYAMTQCTSEFLIHFDPVSEIYLLFFFSFLQCMPSYVTGLLLKTEEPHSKNCILVSSTLMWCSKNYIHETYSHKILFICCPISPSYQPQCVLSAAAVMHVNELHIIHNQGGYYECLLTSTLNTAQSTIHLGLNK